MTYREQRLAKAERLRDWVAKREAKADAAYETAHAISDQIPLGQPILVGHHSEGHMRRDIKRIDNNMRRSVENRAKAKEMTQRADNIEAAARHAVYSDDDDAIEKLEQRIIRLEKSRDELKAVNSAARKSNGMTDDVLNSYSLDMQKAIASWMRYGGASATCPVPAFVLTNLAGSISRSKKRLASLKRKAGVAA